MTVLCNFVYDLHGCHTSKLTLRAKIYGDIDPNNIICCIHFLLITRALWNHYQLHLTRKKQECLLVFVRAQNLESRSINWHCRYWARNVIKKKNLGSLQLQSSYTMFLIFVYSTGYNKEFYLMILCIWWFRNFLPLQLYPKRQLI